MTQPRKDQVFYSHGERITVRRVSKAGLWADIRVEQLHNARWTKRQPLPFPADWSEATA